MEERSARVSRLAVARAKRASFSASRQSRVPVPYPQRRRRCRSRRQKSAGLLSKPSDGLEPLTPSLPCDPVGSRWQSVATIPLVPAVRVFARAVPLPSVAPSFFQDLSIRSARRTVAWATSGPRNLVVMDVWARSNSEESRDVVESERLRPPLHLQSRLHRSRRRRATSGCPTLARRRFCLLRKARRAGTSLGPMAHQPLTAVF